MLSMLSYAIVLVVIVYIIYKFLISPYTLEQKYGFSGPPPKLLFGNFLQYVKKGFHVCDKEDLKKYGSIYPIYFGRIPILVVSDETILRQIFVKDSKSFIDRPKIRGSSKLMKKNLFQLKGKDWERVRALVSPTFTSGKLKKMSPMIVASIEYMMSRFESMKQSEIDIKEVFGSLTMDVIAKTMFGIEIDKDPSNAFVKYAKLSFNISLRNPLLALLNIFPSVTPIIEWLYPRGVISSKSMEFFEKSLIKAINMRRNSTDIHHDFLSLMMTANGELIKNQTENDNTSDMKGLTEDEIMAQSIVFLLAGYETTASALSFCAYYLTMNQDTQEEVYRELQDNLPTDKTITYEMLSKLNLLECCLLETLRICPPVVRVQRLCVKNCSIQASSGQVLNIKKGMILTVPIYAIHHDENIWPEPDRFDIHRFDSEEKQNRSQITFLPFGAGPRVCVGKRFALLEAKLALAHFLMKYKIQPCEKTPKELTFGPSGLTKVLEPVIVRIEER